MSTMPLAEFWSSGEWKKVAQRVKPMGDPTIPNPYPRYPTNEEIYKKYLRGEYVPKRTKEFPGYREPPEQKPGFDRHGNPVDTRTPQERDARNFRGQDREVVREETDRYGRTDRFDAQGKHVVNWEMLNAGDWENTPYANKWTLDMDTVPEGIHFHPHPEDGTETLTEREWKRLMKIYADNPELEEALELHCMYMKSDPQIEFRAKYGLYLGFNKIRWRRGKAIHCDIDSVKEPPRITRDVIKR